MGLDAIDEIDWQVIQPSGNGLKGKGFLSFLFFKRKTEGEKWPKLSMHI
jgi:hypothetical protein